MLAVVLIDIFRRNAVLNSGRECEGEGEYLSVLQKYFKLNENHWWQKL